MKLTTKQLCHTISEWLSIWLFSTGDHSQLQQQQNIRIFQVKEIFLIQTSRTDFSETDFFSGHHTKENVGFNMKY